MIRSSPTWKSRRTANPTVARRPSTGIQASGVSSGPVEATSYGNIAIQLIADGEIRDIETARKIIAASEKLCTFAPENTAEWNKYYKIYLEKVK